MGKNLIIIGAIVSAIYFFASFLVYLACMFNWQNAALLFPTVTKYLGLVYGFMLSLAMIVATYFIIKHFSK